MTRPRTFSPWLFIPTLYFIEGLPYIIVNTVSIYYFKRLGLSNQFIGLTSLLMLPWVLKLFWAPLLDSTGTKRGWVVLMQAALGLCLLSVALMTRMSLILPFVLISLFAAAFFSATHDAAADGYYLLALNARQQAFFAGIRSTAYRIAMIAGGALAALAGILERKTGDPLHGWATTFTFAAAVFFTAAIFHHLVLPRVELGQGQSQPKLKFYGEAFRTYFRQPKIVAVVAFILLYRLGEALLTRMAAPFLLDAREAGGLGLSTATASLLRDVLGQGGLIVGGITGGWLVAKFGLRRCILPMALALNLPDLGYWYLAQVQPGVTVTAIIVIIEQFGYGIGFTAFMIFLMTVAFDPYKTSHYALSTGLMALGMMLPGTFSGYLQSALGYPSFFLVVTLLTIPGMILLRFIPLPEKESS